MGVPGSCPFYRRNGGSSDGYQRGDPGIRRRGQNVAQPSSSNSGGTSGEISSNLRSGGTNKRKRSWADQSQNILEQINSSKTLIDNCWTVNVAIYEELLLLRDQNVACNQELGKILLSGNDEKSSSRSSVNLLQTPETSPSPSDSLSASAFYFPSNSTSTSNSISNSTSSTSSTTSASSSSTSTTTSFPFPFTSTFTATSLRPPSYSLPFPFISTSNYSHSSRPFPNPTPPPPNSSFPSSSSTYSSSSFPSTSSSLHPLPPPTTIAGSRRPTFSGLKLDDTFSPNLAVKNLVSSSRSQQSVRPILRPCDNTLHVTVTSSPVMSTSKNNNKNNKSTNCADSAQGTTRISLGGKLEGHLRSV